MAATLIRQATISDLASLVPLFDAYRKFYEQKADLELAEKFLRDRFEHKQSIVLVAEFDGCAVGFVQMFPSFSSVQAKRIYILNDLFVAPDVRKTGIGRELLNAAVHFGSQNDAARLELSTAIANTVAQSVYEKNGWVRDNEHYYYSINM